MLHVPFQGSAPAIAALMGGQVEFPKIDRGKLYKKLPPPPQDVWRIACFVVAAAHRRRGVATAALHAVLKSISRQGGGVVEAYPVMGPDRWGQQLWWGKVSMFEREGFKRVARLGTSVLMRKSV